MPRKSNASVATSDGNPPNGETKAGRQSMGKDPDTIGIDDLLLPRTLVARLAKGVLPPNTSIGKDALLALTKAASVFVSHIAGTADERTVKKTIMPQDVLAAIGDCEFEMFVDRVGKELNVWEEVVRGKRRGYREKVKMRESGASAIEGEQEGGGKRRKVEAEGETDGKSEEATDEGRREAGGDETEPEPDVDDGPEEGDEEDDEDGEDEEEEDEEQEDEEEGGRDREVDSYGPDDQLRIDMDMDGADSGGESD
ncbi:MAG: hypothetical protein Q9227_005961 [Pyrenula ochraceoflavens]